jgi:purine catabolism regulator
MAIPVRDLLGAPALGGARLIGGHDGLAREVTWTSVIEWQAVGFVRPGELVLTTGIGLDEPTLTRFLGQLLESDAAAVAVSLSPTEPVAAPPAAAVALADRRGVPLIDLPWDVGFADVSRWVVDELIRRRFAGSIDGPAGIHARFAAVLLDGLGMSGIAAALEAALERPVLVFDARLELAGHGPLAAGALGGPGLRTLRLRAASLSAADAGTLAAQFDGEHPRRFAGLDALGLGAGTGRAALARHDTLGFLYILDGERHAEELPNLALRALDEAAASVAIEGLRQRSAAGDRAREDFLWQLVAGLAGPAEDIRGRAALLGFDARVPHELAVARGDGVASRATLERLARELRARSARAGAEVTLGVREDVMVAIAPAAGDQPGPLRRLVVEVQAGVEATQRASWGIAAMARPFTELTLSYGEAQRALEVGRTVVGPANVGDAADLAPYMMLARLGADPEALAIARAVVQPLLAYDGAKGRNLVETLDVYLQESGNTSAAARRLFLNRRSLAYRLQKIEQLTGRALDQPADRFVLDLSIKLLRFGIVDDVPSR